MRPDVLGVVGLGAIGGSLAWQAARAGVPRVVGYSPEPKEGAQAARAGAITDVAPSVAFVAKRADLVVIAAPPVATTRLIREFGTMSATALITDVASVKTPIAHAARAAGLAQRFAGSHPFVGTHERGFAAARPDLFVDSLVYVTPIDEAPAPSREIANFWRSVLEADAVIVEPDTHDELLAWTSHLPQAVASALAVTLAKHGPRGVTYGTGARDMTRLAASSVDMWRDTLLLNRDAVLAALDGFEDGVGGLRRALLDGKPDALSAWLEQGARWRRRFDG